MGCDIHLHTEIMIKGVWYCYASPKVDRWYALFAKMADVRNYESIDPVCQLKGVPDDISVVTALSYKTWGLDAHSASWFDVEEIAELEEWMCKSRSKDKLYWPEMEWGYLFQSSYGDFYKYPDSYPDEVEDVRFIFWFDN